MRLALVSRDVFPLAPGGLGAYVTALADLLAGRAEVTILTTSAHESRYEDLRRTGDPSLPDERVRMEFVPEPSTEEGVHYVGHQHAFGARVFERLCELYPDGGPDLIEVPDYLGEGAVVVGARRVRDRSLANAKVAVRAYTTSEMCYVLNGSLPDDPSSSKLFTLERYSLRHADCLVWPGGDVLETYRRFYGSMPLASAVEIRHPLASGPDTAPSFTPPAREDGELRVLYLGRLERRKGVQALVKALTGIPADWRLTLAGSDTPTAPLGLSMRGQLELMASGDSRITFLDHVERSEIPSLVADHHVVTIPSRWECWPNVGLEALRGNRPIAVTPVGGLRAMAGASSGESEGDGGWIARDPSAEAIAELFERLLAEGELVEAAVSGGGPRRRFEALTDPEPIIAGYERLAEDRPAPPARPRAGGKRPLVSVVVPYFKLDDYVGEAVESAFEQTYAPIEVIVVNDGATREQDAVLAALATRYPIRVVLQPNTGLGAARNFGISQASGRYVLPLDADNALEPSFVQDAVEVLEREDHLAYVTSWARYVDENGDALAGGAEGYHPLGNEKPMLNVDNAAGDAMAVVRRRVFDLGFAYSTELTSFEDWMLYRELAEAGWTGLVIPRRLLRYRVRADSMLREIGIPHIQRLNQEMQALLRERQVRWVS